MGSGSDGNIAQASSSGDDHAQQAVIEVSAGVAPRTDHPEHLKPAQQKTVTDETLGKVISPSCSASQHSAKITEKNDEEKFNIQFAPGTKRAMMELCTSKDSELGDQVHQLEGAAVVRVTLDHDLTTPAGLSFALAVVRAARAENLPLCLYLSLPCTAGCPYWRCTLAKQPKTASKLQQHVYSLGVLLQNVEIIHKYAVAAYGDRHVLVIKEWPKGCQLWQHQAVESFRLALGLSFDVQCHGCQLGWVSSNPKHSGLPNKKPLKIASSDEKVLEHFASYQCTGCTHAIIEGKDTKNSQNYREKFATVVHSAFSDWSKRTAFETADKGWTTLKSSAAYPQWETVADAASVEQILLEALGKEQYHAGAAAAPEGQQHREKITTQGIWCAMVTQPLSPKDPKSRSPIAMEAVNKELAALR